MIYVLVGLLILTLITFQVVYFALSGKLELLNFFSLFTIQSNLLSAIVFILTKHKHQIVDYLRGPATLSLLITSFGYIFLLGNTQDYLLPSVNIVVHYLAPGFALLSWIIHPPNIAPTIKSSTTWLLFPFLFFAYSMARGAVTGWYPYDFIDPNKTSSHEIAITFTSVLIGSLILSWMLALIATNKSQSNP